MFRLTKQDDALNKKYEISTDALFIFTGHSGSP